MTPPRKYETGVQVRVLTFMRDHPGVPYHYGELAQHLGIAGERANAALVRLHNNALIPLVRIRSGTYQFGSSPEHKSGSSPESEEPGSRDAISGTIFEAVGRTADGRLAVRDPDTEIIRFLDDK